MVGTGAASLRERGVLLALVCCLCAAVFVESTLVGDLPVVGDAPEYLDIARGGWGAQLWLGPRPPLYPILLKLFGGGIYTAQRVLYAVAAGFLLLAAAKRYGATAWSLLVVVPLWLVVANHHYVFWSSAVLTESATFSLLLVLVGIGAHPGISESLKLRLAAVLLCALAAIKDVLLYFSQPLALFLAAFWLAVSPRGLAGRREAPREARRGLAVAAALSLVFFAYCWLGQRVAQRYRINLIDVIQSRVLTNATALGYFEAAGMRVGPVLSGRRWKTATDAPEDFRTAEWREFSAWVAGKGYPTFAGLLATHPEVALRWLSRDRSGHKNPPAPEQMDDVNLPRLLDLHVRTVLYQSVGGTVADAIFGWALGWVLTLPITSVGYSLAVALAVALACIGLAVWRKAPAIDFPPLLALATVPGLLDGYLADSWDMLRHELPFVLAAELALVLLVADVATHRMKRRWDA